MTVSALMLALGSMPGPLPVQALRLDGHTVAGWGRQPDAFASASETGPQAVASRQIGEGIVLVGCGAGIAFDRLDSFGEPPSS